MEEIVIKFEHVNDDRCRVCLELKESPICLLNASSLKDEQLSYWDILHLISNIETENVNNTPQKICVPCAERAEVCYRFKLLCESSDKILQSELASYEQTNRTVSKTAIVHEVDANVYTTPTTIYFNDEITIITNTTHSNSVEAADTKNVLTEQLNDCTKVNIEDVAIHNNSDIVNKNSDDKDVTIVNNRNSDNKDVTIDNNRNRDNKDVTIDNNRNSDNKNVTIDNNRNSDNTNVTIDKNKNSGDCKSSDTTKSLQTQKIKEYGPLKCHFCDYTNFSTLKLGKHLTLSHNDKKSVQCTKCDKKFFTERHLLTHIKRQHGENVPNVCEVCGKTFGEKGNLVKHMYIHNGTQRYECKQCSKRFTSYAALYLHENIHVKDRKFVCEICGSQFKAILYLNKHVRRLHTEKKLAECTICLKQLSDKSIMKRHLQNVHGGLRSYKCDLCDKAFSTSNNLKTHQTVHTGERAHACDICGKRFSQAHVLRTHLKTHTKAKKKV